MHLYEANMKLLFVQQDAGLSESMEIDHNSSANFDEVHMFSSLFPLTSVLIFIDSLPFRTLLLGRLWNLPESV